MDETRDTETESTKTMWAYAYEMVPPQSADRLAAIQQLLDNENAEARRGTRSWTGKVVVEEHVTHILVVSDNPEQDHHVNKKLEAELKGLNAGFSISVPLALS